MSPADAYLETVKRIEPDVHPIDADGAAASMSISQKRMADALERIALCLENPGQVITVDPTAPAILSGQTLTKAEIVRILNEVAETAKAAPYQPGIKES